MIHCKLLKRPRVGLSLLLLVHTLLLGYAAWWMSPTLDEPAHIVAGISHWRTADFSLYRVNPPLVRMVATLPALLAGYQFDFPDVSAVQAGRPEFRLGEQFVHVNGRWSLWLTTLGRWACIPFSWLGAVVCYRWAKELYGQASGWLACSLWCFSPMVLGHAALLTPDAHAAALGLLACYTFWHWLRQPTWARAISTGLILGLAELSKTTLILLYPLWPVLWLAYRWSERRAMTWRRWRDEGLMLLLRMLIGLYVINLGYLGNGSFVQLKEYTFVSDLFKGNAGDQLDGRSRGPGNRFRDSWLGELPVPLPYDYIKGIDVQQRDFENFGRPSYLRGHFQEQGWWYYYLYAALVKTPLGTWGLILLAITARCRWPVSHLPVSKAPVSKSLWRDEMVLLAPAAIIFVVVSAKTGFSHHYRYIFPCLPLVMIWTSSVLRNATPLRRSRSSSLDSPQSRRLSHKAPRHSIATRSILTAACLSATISSSLWHFPHSLAYFNAAVGGPQRGAEHLISSNIDWGQDLMHLERWIKLQGGETPVYLAFDDYLNPFDLGIAHIAPWPLAREAEDSPTASPPEIGDGLYALSINQLYEFPWSLRQRDGSRYFIDQRPLKALRSQPPIGRAGYSINIYSAEQLRSAYQTVQQK